MSDIKLRYSEPLLRQAVRAYATRAIARGFGPPFFVACVALTLCIAYLIYNGDRSWLVGVLGATLLFVGIFFYVIYAAHYRNIIGRFRQMRVPEATLSYSEESFTLTSELGSSTMPWTSITEVWRYPKFWLILFSPSQFATLPLDNIDEAAQAFILRKTQHEPANA